VKNMSSEIIYQDNINKIKKLLDINIATLLIGEAGMGKSFSSVEACKQANRPYTTINLSKQHDLVDLLGQYILKGNETIWVNQKVTNAVEQGKVLILEELTMAEPTILAALHGLIEQPPKLHTLNGDVEIHPDFRVIGTANPAWTNYMGVSDLNYAFQDRFAHIIFGFPNKKDFKTFIMPYEVVLGQHDINVGTLYKATHELFDMYPEQNSYYMSLRGLKFFCQLLECDYNKKEAMEISFINKINPEEKESILDIIDKYIPITERR
jgi:nitric oxide reductase NorQ protein